MKVFTVVLLAMALGCGAAEARPKPEMPGFTYGAPARHVVTDVRLTAEWHGYVAPHQLREVPRWVCDGKLPSDKEAWSYGKRIGDDKLLLASVWTTLGFGHNLIANGYAVKINVYLWCG